MVYVCGTGIVAGARTAGTLVEVARAIATGKNPFPHNIPLRRMFLAEIRIDMSRKALNAVHNLARSTVSRL